MPLSRNQKLADDLIVTPTSKRYNKEVFYVLALQKQQACQTCTVLVAHTAQIKILLVRFPSGSKLKKSRTNN